MSQTMISVRMDDALKANWANVCEELGINISTVITALAKKMSREKRIPFEISIDPFYSNSNLRALDESIDELKKGKVVIKTIEELESMEK